MGLSQGCVPLATSDTPGTVYRDWRLASIHAPISVWLTRRPVREAVGTNRGDGGASPQRQCPG